MPPPHKKSFAAEQLARQRKTSPLPWILLLIIVVIIGSYLVYSRYIAVPVKAEITSIAVLPLTNLTGDPEQEYFCDGMHEALIADLSKIRAMRVIARTSVMGYRDTEKKVPEIAKELGVDALIEGSVFRADGTVRITVQLIGAFPEQHLWSSNYVRDIKDVIMMQQEVARAIADEIEITVTQGEKVRLSGTRAVNPEAYELYMMGRHFKRTLRRSKSLDYFLKAVEKDSSFAAPYAEIAIFQTFVGRSAKAPLKAFTEAKTALERAFELDDTLPGAYTAQGLINMYCEWDWRTAEDNFKKAIELDPSYTDTYIVIENLFTLLGKGQEALELQRKALEIDPFSVEIMRNIMRTLEYLEDYEEALQLHQRIVEIDSTSLQNYSYAGIIYAAQGKYEEAIATFTKARQISGSSGPNANIGYVYALMGKREEAEKILAEVLEAGRSGYSIRLGLKDFDPIFEDLENLYNERSPLLVDELRSCEILSKDIVSDPRWKDLLKKMGLPED